MKKAELPPIGVEPRKNYEQYTKFKRLIDVCGAIIRYYEARKPIKIEWIEEYNELIVQEYDYSIVNCEEYKKPDMSFGW